MARGDSWGTILSQGTLGDEHEMNTFNDDAPLARNILGTARETRVIF
jgi:hypothetical protein